ncbi:MAG: hypothetical protein M1827_006317 [Pycnora praestabilis]|nr:MAG: hypothetical protein M1827_006317 [Pycnora praestabilis]
MLTTLLIVFLLVAFSISAPNPGGFLSTLKAKQRRQTATFSINGVSTGRGPDGSVPFRQEIRQLQRNADQWNLYLLALQRLQQVDQSDQFSWYQIAGIHGRPFASWDGVQASLGDSQSGYCTHSSILFPTWHRPFLVLYEQVLYSLMQEIVNEFPAGPQQDNYTAAAADFRIPYWDWAVVPPSGEDILPDSISSETVQVTTPNGTTTINNPLFSYTFHPLNSTEVPDEPFASWQNTLRSPTNQSANAVSQNSLVSQQLSSSRQSFQDRLYNLFTAYPQYQNFSNKAWIPSDGGNYDSIESLHDQLHGLLGSGGHMAIVEYSAFDPIFFLHHAMIDRAFAMWQALYPDSYVIPEPSEYGTFTTSPGSTEDANTGLTPFHSDTNGDLWISDSVRNPQTFGYTYPELVTWNVSTSQYQANVRTSINTLYGSNASTSITSSLPSGKRSAADNISERSTAGDNSTMTYREYITNILVPNNALGTSFFIHIFLGPVPSTPPSTWSISPNLVGTHCIFTSAQRNTTNTATVAADDHDDNDGGQQVTGGIPLTSALRAKVAEGDLPSLPSLGSVSIIEAYLTKNLHWRVTMLNGMSIPLTSLPTLKVSVVSSEVSPPTPNNVATDFPTWGAFTVHESVTNGKPGGHCIGDPV